MLYVFYVIIIPQLYQTTIMNFLLHFIFGSWLSVNTFFHYTMGLVTNPGQPSNVKFYVSNLIYF
jgi:hypothetical protein